MQILVNIYVCGALFFSLLLMFVAYRFPWKIRELAEQNNVKTSTWLMLSGVIYSVGWPLVVVVLLIDSVKRNMSK